MTMKPLAGSAAMIARRTTSAAFAAIALILMAACSRQPSGSVSVKFTAATNEAAEAQLKAATTLGIPVEKMLPKSGILLRLIPAGTFLMGSPKSEQDAVVQSLPAKSRADVRKRLTNETQHKVTLTKAFYIGKYEVTQGQWTKVMGSNPSKFKDAGDDAPVETVSWHDCTDFMEKLAVLEGIPEGSFKLPTEAQWEYACRAGTDTAFSYGDDLDSSMANFGRNYPYGKGKIVSVGQFKPNAWGLHDMHGNVWEWCADWYGEYEGDATNPSGAASGSYRVSRGGGWCTDAFFGRSAVRFSFGTPGLTDYGCGFRLSLPTGQQSPL